MNNYKNNSDLFVFIGSLDPIHNSHIELIEFFPEVIVIPTYNPFKNNSLLSIEERLSVLNKIEFKNEVKILSFIKENPEFYSKMKNIIPELIKLYPNKNIKYIMGTDTYNGIPSWDGYPSFVEDLFCIVFPRDEEIILNPKIKTNLIDYPIKTLSSSEIKKFVQLRDLDKIRPLVPDFVFQFILKKINKDF